MRVLGIDPGSRITGYGIVENVDGNIRHVDNGNITPDPKSSFPKKLHHIFVSIEDVIATFKPDVVAVENVFVAKNVRSSLILGHARGTAIVAASKANLEVKEYTPSQIKKAIAGTGSATKEQVQRMVQIVLNMPEVACEDASDALAVAICHLNCSSFEEKLARSIRGS